LRYKDIKKEERKREEMGRGGGGGSVWDNPDAKYIDKK
jgi:hypothetical protein